MFPPPCLRVESRTFLSSLFLYGWREFALPGPMTFTEHPEWPTMLGDTTDLGRGRIGCKDSREYFRSNHRFSLVARSKYIVVLSWWVRGSEGLCGETVLVVLFRAEGVGAGILFWRMLFYSLTGVNIYDLWLIFFTPY